MASTITVNQRTPTIGPVEPRTFTPGSLGWRVSDLDDAEIEEQWTKGRYEIISGVLTSMAAANFDPGRRFMRLCRQVIRFLEDHDIKGDFSAESDIILDDLRLVVADMVWMTPEQIQRQESAAIRAGRVDTRRARIYVPPTLVIESVSYGHEDHDRVTKFNWYTEFGVPNYWIFDGLGRRLDCFVLVDGAYRLAAGGHNEAKIAAPLFDGLIIDMAAIWHDG